MLNQVLLSLAMIRGFVAGFAAIDDSRDAAMSGVS